MLNRSVVLLPLALLLVVAPEASTPPARTPHEGPAIERLEGQAAIAYMRAQFRRHPELQQAAVRAETALRGRGYLETPDVHVVKIGTPRAGRVSLPGKLKQFLFPALQAQHGASHWQGSITFWTWDDGNPYTWEGRIDVEDYEYGSWTVYGEQIETESYNEPYVIWADRYDAGGYMWDAPVGLEGSPSGCDPRLAKVQYWGNCGCAGCGWNWQTQSINQCWGRSAMVCAGWKAPAIVGSCRLSQRMGMGPWAACAVSVGAYDLISCHVDAFRQRWNQCGWCG